MCVCVCVCVYSTYVHVALGKILFSWSTLNVLVRLAELCDCEHVLWILSSEEEKNMNPGQGWTFESHRSFHGRLTIPVF